MYTGYVIKANRVGAQSELLKIARNLSNYKLVKYTYKGVALSNNTLKESYPLTGKVFYEIELSVAADNMSWKLTATPQGQMLNTGNLTLDSTGKQCWEKTSGACEPWDGK
ncbi:type IV pilin protein [Acinetobacter sp. YH16056_T]|nr:type IV pilin protein [Acinetobacter sp. YH16056_T]